MKKKFAVVAIVLMSIGLVGCASWIQQFKNNPVQMSEEIISAIETVVQIATGLFGQIEPQLPVAQQEPAKIKFGQAVVVVENLKATLQQLVNTAIATNTTPPDLTGVIAQADTALQDIQTLVASFQTVLGEKSTVDPLASAITNFESVKKNYQKP